MLRLWNLADQVPGGDELHAVRIAVSSTLPEILTTFHESDGSIPLTALDRIALVAFGQITEATIRAPIVAAALVTPALALLVRKPLGAPVAALFAWLLAVAPWLVAYGRVARPYAIEVVLAFAAVVWCSRAWRDGRTGPGIGYAAAAGAGFWLSPVFAPFFAAPLVVAAILSSIAPGRDGRSRELKRIAAMGGGAFVIVAAVIGPALPSLLELARTKTDNPLPTPTGWLAVLVGHAGTARLPVFALVLVLAAAGALELGRRYPAATALGAATCAAQLAAVLAVAPWAAASPVVAGRYLLVLQPFLLLAVALGVDRLGRVVHRRIGRGGAGFVGAAFVALWFVTGPIVDDPGLRLGPFAGSEAAVAFWNGAPRVPAAELRPRPDSLAGNGAVATGIWPVSWVVSPVPSALQRALHRDVVWVHEAEDRLSAPGVRFRNLVPALPERILASRARWLVVHRKPAATTTVVEGAPRAQSPQALARHQGERVRERAIRLRAAWGAPDLRDADAWVWDLDRVRAHQP